MHILTIETLKKNILKNLWLAKFVAKTKKFDLLKVSSNYFEQHIL